MSRRGQPGNVITINGPTQRVGPLLARRRGMGGSYPANGGTVQVSDTMSRWFCPDETPTGERCVPLDGNEWCNPTPPTLPMFGGYINQRTGQYCQPANLPSWARAAAKRWRQRSVPAFSETLGAEGDWFDPCGSPDCESGRRKVTLMSEVYARLGKPPQFGPAVESILATFAKINPTVTLFNSKCCAVRDLGAQAEALTQRMLAAANVAAPPSTTTSSGGWWKWALSLAALGGAGYVGYRAWQTHGHMARSAYNRLRGRRTESISGVRRRPAARR